MASSTRRAATASPEDAADQKGLAALKQAKVKIVNADKALVNEVRTRSDRIIEDWIAKANAKGVDAPAVLAEFRAELKKVLIFLYQSIHWVRKKELDQECYELMARWLWGFMIIAVILELMEVLSIAYERTERWAVLEQLISGELKFSYVYMQILVFSIIPFIFLTITSIFKFNIKIKNILIWISSGMLLIQVLLMRWNVVIGGQLVSKSMRGFTEYFPGVFDKEVIIVSIVIILIPFVLLRLFDSIFPFFHKKKVRRIFFSEYE